MTEGNEEQTAELVAPFIENEWQKHLSAVTMQGKIKLSKMIEFQMRQSFFGGFTRAMHIMEGAFISEADKQSFSDGVKEELKLFNESNRNFAKAAGTQHQRVPQ